MEILVMPAFIIFALFCIHKQNQWRERQRQKAATAVKPKPEPIESVVAKIKEKERRDRAKDKRQWEKDYLKTLPIEEHPDYFVPSPYDEKDYVEYRNFAQEVLYRSEWWVNSRGQTYTATPDWATETVTIRCGEIQWKLPLDEYRFLFDN